ncbi:MAG: hypothetical protein M3N53_02205 [Actinomycetota bacterium]|nr:hypothetical protein [Actinomycetota bacterium]
MFGNRSGHAHGTTGATHGTTAEPLARGGIAFGPILTGVVVAFGCMFLLSAIVGGVLAALGLAETNVTEGEAIEAGIGAGIALVIAQFLSYLWGGYTAGRMARGSGIGNGLLVPLTALIVAAVVGAIATGLGATANLNLPFTTNQLPLENNNLVDWGIGIGIASLVAMFLGGALGGGMGARWHSKLERNAAEDATASHHEVDLRDDTPPSGTHTTTQADTADERAHDSAVRR